MRNRQVLFLFLFLLITQGNLEAGIVAHWRLDGNALDETGNHNGSIGGIPNWTSGKFGSAIDMDGTTNYIRVSDSSELTLGTGTLAAWVNVRNLPENTSERLICHLSGFYYQGNAKGYEWVVEGEGYHKLITYNGSLRTSVKSDNFVTYNDWYHLAVTWDGNLYKAYVDGSLSGSATMQTFNPGDPVQDLYIGSHYSVQYMFDGLMDDVRIYDHALGEDELKLIIPEAGTILMLSLGIPILSGFLRRKKQPFLRRRKMKRLMTIFFILALTNFANAGVVDTVITYLNGQPISPTKEITIKPSDEVGLGIIYTPSPDRTLFLLSVDMFASVPGLEIGRAHV